LKCHQQHARGDQPFHSLQFKELSTRVSFRIFLENDRIEIL